MAKIMNLRERIHQPFRDALCRLSGWTQGLVPERSLLFTAPGRDDGATNLQQGAGTLPSDQSFVVLALRVLLWFRNPIARGAPIAVGGGTGYVTNNGDFAFAGVGNTYDMAQSLIANGSAPASTQDVHRLYNQASEQILWSFGAGEKLSMTSMPSMYFPYGGGLHGDLAGATDLIHWNNGMPDNQGILRLARCILIPPRQGIKAIAQCVALDAGQNAALFGTSTARSRNMLSIRDNLNAVDGAPKIVSLTFDGLFSRDVQ